MDEAPSSWDASLNRHHSTKRHVPALVWPLAEFRLAALTNAPRFTGTNWFLSLPATVPPAFYRLRLP